MFLKELKILMVDNRSKHLWKIINFLKKKGTINIRVDPLLFDLRKLKHENIDGIILTGGSTRSTQKKRGFNFRVIRLFDDKPILGICLGHEFLAEFYKGALYRMNFRAKDLSYIHIRKDNELISRGSILVYKGHSFAAGILPDCFEGLAWSNDCENEMIKHKKRMHFGAQFHPEKTSDGHTILNNFLKLCK